MPDRRPAWVGAVLTGGASRRMGHDKALIVRDGRALARRAADALLAAGAAEVVAVGGDRAAVEALGLAWCPERWPGEGPLGGVVSALSASGEGRPVTMVVACDLLDPSPTAIAAVVAALAARPGTHVAVPLRDGRYEPLHAAYRSTARPLLEAAFAAGERSPTRALRSLAVVHVAVEPASLDDADTPADL